MRTIILTLLSFSLYSQSYQAPREYTLEKPEDYARYEEQLLQSIEWLSETPIGKDDTEHLLTYRFIMDWAVGAPNVTIHFSSEVIPFMKKPEMLIAFMAGWIQKALTNEDPISVFEGNKAGITYALAFYEMNRKKIGKVKGIKGYVKAKEEGRLDEEIIFRMEKQSGGE